MTHRIEIGPCGEAGASGEKNAGWPLLLHCGAHARELYCIIIVLLLISYFAFYTYFINHGSFFHKVHNKDLYQKTLLAPSYNS